MKVNKNFVSVLLLVYAIAYSHCNASENIKSYSNNYVQFNLNEQDFPIVINNKATPIITDTNEFSGVRKIIKFFQNDIYMVSGTEPGLVFDNSENTDNIIIVGTLGKNRLINELVLNGKLDVSDLKGKWETSLIQVIEKPFENIDRALLIVGSDKRGTIYGMFDISRKMGVSPWYWWADVPVKKHREVYIKKGRYNLGEPKVKYRGIFLNDEEPALGRWALENYDGFTHEFYEKVFELLLRLKGNYLWPAMWWASFNSDDTLNPVIADEMGIVMGTSHHEPMMRAHAEWKKYGKGEWNYITNEQELKKFWKEGIQRMGEREGIVTMGMRGDGDVAMSQEANTDLLEKIVEDQRQIIEEITEKKAQETPQLWALYKEVQEYYDIGMTVPDDVTLLLCDDNWGNVRHLPNIDTAKRKGGYGMYYHIDFVGGPRSYKWLNVSHISRIWEQMNLCYNYGVSQIWLVNVGDLKPMELPVSFFIDFAWDPEKWTASNLMEYHIKWAKEQFGDTYSEEIAEILWLYTKFNRRRTPEMLDANTYSLTNYREFERVTAEYDEIFQKSVKIYDRIESTHKDAYFQLVHYPVWACSNLYKMYFARARNQLFYKQQRAAANDMAKKVKLYFKEDTLITWIYNKKLAVGKWNHMAAQTHIGYTSWNEPRKNILPSTKTITIEDKTSMGVTYLGTDEFWTSGNIEVKLPMFDSYNKQSNFIEIFNTGSPSFEYEIKSGTKWIILSNHKGLVELQDTIKIDIDWNAIGYGKNEGEITLRSQVYKENVKFKVQAYKHNEAKEKAKGFIERDGYVSMEANHFSNKGNQGDVSWSVVPGLSRTESGITTMPVNKSFSPNEKQLPFLEYQFHLINTPPNDSVTIHLNVAPTHNFSGKGLYYAIAIDDEEPQIVDIHKNSIRPDWEYPGWFNSAVSNYSISSKTKHKVTGMGNHVLKLFMISSGVIFQKLVIDNGGLKRSYLGPPESISK